MTARLQHGYLTHSQLVALGLSTSAIERRTKRGSLHREHRGVYLYGHGLAPPYGRARAAVLACGRDALLIEWSCLFLYDLTKEPASHQIGVPNRRAPRHEKIVTRTTGVLEVRTRHGLPTCRPARAICDVAADADEAVLLALIREAQFRGLARDDELLTSPGRGAHIVRALLAEPDWTASVAEDRFKELLIQGGIEVPRINHLATGHRVDFFWEHLGVVVEIDGESSHGHRLRREHDRRRDADHIAAGRTRLRFSWRQLQDEPMRVLVVVASALARSAERRGL